MPASARRRLVIALVDDVDIAGPEGTWRLARYDVLDTPGTLAVEGVAATVEVWRVPQAREVGSTEVP